MRHLIVADYGTFVGLKSERVVVRSDAAPALEVPLRDLRSIKIAKSGVSISSDLILQCAVRGINLYFTNFKGEASGFLIGASQHAVAQVRRSQFSSEESELSRELARTFVYGKIRNQRATLLYFGKYARKSASVAVEDLSQATERMAASAEQVWQMDLTCENWRSKLMGAEGSSATTYFQAWRSIGVPLETRLGRGATDPVNSALNYGYAILKSHVWTAVINAGLEPYVGVLHVGRPGRPSLVLDIMEEYKAWVVDRVVIKLMSKRGRSEFDSPVRRALIEEIQKVIAGKVPFEGKRLRLETVIQRRVYRVAGSFVAGRLSCRPLLFKW
jgi:CRISPR-associated protein Cas1